MIIIYLVYLLHTIRLLTKHSKLMLFVLIYFDCEASNFVNQILGNDGKVHSSMKKHMLLDYTCLYIVHTSTWMIDTCLYIVHTSTCMIDTCLYIKSPRHSILMKTGTVMVVLRIVNFPFYIKSCAFAKNMHIAD